MFSRIKKLSGSINKKFILTLLVFASPVVFLAFITTSCGTWDKTVTGPNAAVVLTATAVAAAQQTATFTPTSACPNPPAINLGGAGNYALLAQTDITDTLAEACVVTGNVGLSPSSGSQIGVDCSEMVAPSIIYEIAGNGYTGTNRGCGVLGTTLGTDVANMATAYTTANGLSYCVENLGAGTLSGLTLTRGVYNWTSNLLITTDIYLDAQGNPNNSWVMQIAGNFSLLAGIQIHLINGALAQNVLWTVAGTSSATLGTNSKFVGILMAGPSCLIAAQTNASVNGRLLSQTAITLDSNVITQQ